MYMNSLQHSHLLILGFRGHLHYILLNGFVWVSHSEVLLHADSSNVAFTSLLFP